LHHHAVFPRYNHPCIFASTQTGMLSFPYIFTYGYPQIGL
jgi:hypothetical protein